MIYALIMLMTGADGREVQHPMALFPNKDDCELVGFLTSQHLTLGNARGIMVKFTCEPAGAGV